MFEADEHEEMRGPTGESEVDHFANQPTELPDSRTLVFKPENVMFGRFLSLEQFFFFRRLGIALSRVTSTGLDYELPSISTCVTRVPL